MNRIARRAGLHAPRARGFTLVESLVALVVLSIGMLGIAGLYLESVRSGRTSILRSQAVALATDLADRIRANRAGGPQYDDGASGAGAILAACEDGGAGCTPNEMAGHDKAQWLDALATTLPNGDGTVEVDAASRPDTYTITVTWTEPGIGDQTYTLSFQT